MKKNIVLGVHVGHDRGAAIMKNGEIIGNIAQERLDRKKHSRSIAIPYQSIDRLLEYHNIDISEVCCVGLSGDAMEASNILDTMRQDFYAHYNIRIPCYFVPHHDSHAYAAFCSSGHQKSLILIADGGGDYFNNFTEAESLYVGSLDGIIPVKKRWQAPTIRRMGNECNYLLPHMPMTIRRQEISIARKYEQITYLLGFGWGEAGKTMGLASYGKSLIDFSNLNILSLDFSLKYEDILDDLMIFQKLSGLDYHEFILRNSADIAQTVQEYTEKAIISIIKNITAKYGIKHICLGGGLFLNCILNHKILEQCNLNDIFVFPASGDDGQAIGNAFFAYSRQFPEKAPAYTINLPFLGLSYSDDEIEQELHAWNLNYQKCGDNILAQKMAQAISESKIIAFHRGRTEIGPRALCHRSILANPLDPDMKDILNKRIKHREEFRPFAPVVTEEMEKVIFNLKQSSPYMLFAPTVNSDFLGKLPSITHVDNTARVQSVSKESDPFMHLLLNKFAEITGIPVIINTSFNVAGQPIVESPIDAISTFISNDIDILVLGNYWIERLA